MNRYFTIVKDRFYKDWMVFRADGACCTFDSWERAAAYVSACLKQGIFYYPEYFHGKRIG